MDKKPKGQPKWDWIVTLRIPLNFKRMKINIDKIGKGFIKRLIKKAWEN